MSGHLGKGNPYRYPYLPHSLDCQQEGLALGSVPCLLLQATEHPTTSSSLRDSGLQPGTVVDACYANTWEVQTGGWLVGCRPACATQLDRVLKGHTSVLAQ